METLYTMPRSPPLFLSTIELLLRGMFQNKNILINNLLIVLTRHGCRNINNFCFYLQCDTVRTDNFKTYIKYALCFYFSVLSHACLKNPFCRLPLYPTLSQTFKSRLKIHVLSHILLILEF